MLAPFGPDATQLSAAAWHGQQRRHRHAGRGPRRQQRPRRRGQQAGQLVRRRLRPARCQGRLQRVEAVALRRRVRPRRRRREGHRGAPGDPHHRAPRDDRSHGERRRTPPTRARSGSPAPGSSRTTPTRGSTTTSFRPSKHRHLTHQQARAIDSAIDQYNTTITSAVRQARTEGRDWYVMDLCGLLDSLAYRRFDDDPLAAKRNDWVPYVLPHADRHARHPVLPVEQGRPASRVGCSGSTASIPPSRATASWPRRSSTCSPSRGPAAHHRLRRAAAAGLAQLAAPRPGPGHARDPRPVRDGPGQPPQRGVAQPSPWLLHRHGDPVRRAPGSRVAPMRRRTFATLAVAILLIGLLAGIPAPPAAAATCVGSGGGPPPAAVTGGFHGISPAAAPRHPHGAARRQGPDPGRVHDRRRHRRPRSGAGERHRDRPQRHRGRRGRPRLRGGLALRQPTAGDVQPQRPRLGADTQPRGDTAGQHPPRVPLHLGPPRPRGGHDGLVRPGRRALPRAGPDPRPRHPIGAEA